MKKIAFLALLFCSGFGEALAHPGSGILVDRDGNVYFVDTGSGVYKIDTQGNLTRIEGPAYHWMAIDLDDALASTELPYFSTGDATFTPVGKDPTLILSSDFPVTVGPSGDLYYPRQSAGEQLKMFRLTAKGTTNAVTEIPPNPKTGTLRWLNGVDSAPDGSVYYSENDAIRRITPQGSVVTVIENVKLPDCSSVPGSEALNGVYLRGLDVDAEGNVYVAAAGCGAVLRIAADQTVTTILRASSPWSPTGVALSGKDLYVLEYLHTEGDDRSQWKPRVRKVASDGKVTTVAIVER